MPDPWQWIESLPAALCLQVAAAVGDARRCVRTPRIWQNPLLLHLQREDPAAANEGEGRRANCCVARMPPEEEGEQAKEGRRRRACEGTGEEETYYVRRKRGGRRSGARARPVRRFCLLRNSISHGFSADVACASRRPFCVAYCFGWFNLSHQCI